MAFKSGSTFFSRDLSGAKEVEALAQKSPVNFVRLMGVVYTENGSLFGFVKDDEWEKSKQDLASCLELTAKTHRQNLRDTIPKILESFSGTRNVRFITFDRPEQHPQVIETVQNMYPFTDSEKEQVEKEYNMFVAAEHSLEHPDGKDYYREGTYIPNVIAPLHLNVHIQYTFAMDLESGKMLEKVRQTLTLENTDFLMKALGPEILRYYSEFFWLLAFSLVREEPGVSRILFDYLGDAVLGDYPYLVDVFWGLLSDIERKVSRNYVRGFIETNAEFLVNLSEERKRLYMETLLIQNNPEAMRLLRRIGFVPDSFEFSEGYELRELLGDEKKVARNQTLASKKAGRQFTFVAPPKKGPPNDSILVPLKSTPTKPPRQFLQANVKSSRK